MRFMLCIGVCEIRLMLQFSVNEIQIIQYIVSARILYNYIYILTIIQFIFVEVYVHSPVLQSCFLFSFK